MTGAEAAGLAFGVVVAGTRAAILARFCSTFSWASRNCKLFRLRNSESLLRLLVDVWGDHRLEEPFMDSGGAGVGREFSSGFEDGGGIRKMDVWEDFEGIVELDEMDVEVFRAEFTNETIIGRERYEGALPGDGIIN